MPQQVQRKENVVAQIPGADSTDAAGWHSFFTPLQIGTDPV